MADVRINVKVIGDSAQKAVTNLGRSAKKTESQFKALNVSVSNTTSAFKVFAGNVAANVFSSAARGISSLASAAFDATTSLETISTQFEVLTGSASEADKVIRDIQQFAANTPFQFQDLAKAGQQLLSFGFDADSITDRLSNLGDVAAASGTPIRDLSLIFGQVSAAGKLTGERLLQLQERAIPIGPAIAKTLGVAESSVRDLVSRGEVDFKTFEAAFQSLSQEGEFAFDGIAKRSQTLEGRISTLKDNFELLAAGLGQTFVPALKAVVGGLTEFLQQITQSDGFDRLIRSIGEALPTAIELAVNGFRVFVDFVLDAISISGVVISVFGAVVQSLVQIRTAALEAGQAVDRFLGGQNQAEYERLIKDNEALAKSIEDVSVEALNFVDEFERSRSDFVQIARNSSQTVIDIFNTEAEASTANKDTVVANNQAIVESEQQKISLRDLLREEELESFRTAEDEFNIIQQLKSDERFHILSEGLGQEEAAKIAARARELSAEGKHQEALKLLTNARIKAEAQSVANEDKLNKQRESDRASSLSKIATLQSSNNKTLAAIGKAAALTQIAIDGPQAVTKALAAFPPPFNFAAATAVAAAVAAQAANVAGIGFQDGGIVPGSSFSGDNVPARVNSGEMILNRQQQSQLFAIANGSNVGGAQEVVSNITVELDGDVVARAVSRKVADGLELGEIV